MFSVTPLELLSEPETLLKLSRRVAKRIVQRPPGVEWADACQDAAVIILELLPKWVESDKFPFIAWIYVRTLGELCDKYRREWRRHQKLGMTCRDPMWFDAIAVQLADVEPGLDVQALKFALETLPEKQREVLVALYHDGRGQSEVAKERGISQPAVSKLAGRGIARLRRTLLGDDTAPSPDPAPVRSNRGNSRQFNTVRLSSELT